MFYTQRLTEALEIVAPAINAYTDGTAANTGTSGTADMSKARRTLAIGIGIGTGTCNVTIQAGTVTYGTRSDGLLTTGGIPTWVALTGGTNTVGATHTLTQGELKVIEVLAEHMPTGARYLRGLVANGTANTFGTLVFINAVEREKPVSTSGITATKIV